MNPGPDIIKWSFATDLSGATFHLMHLPLALIPCKFLLAGEWVQHKEKSEHGN